MKKNMSVKTVVVAIATLIVARALSPVPAAYAAPGDLDGTFGNNGQVITRWEGGGFNHYYGDAMAVQRDGKIVVAGSNYGGFSQRFLVVLYNSNGSLETMVTSDFIDGETYNTASAVAIQPDGKIVAAGFSGTDFALARYNSDLTLDGAFGDGGKVTTNYSVSGAGDRADAVAVQPDGKIVVAGSSYDAVEYDEFALLRYNSDGSLDSTFGDGGIVITSIGDITEDRAYAVAIQPDGKIIVAGESFHDFAVARYNSDGRLDDSFGDGGIVTTDFGGESAAGYAVAIQADGKIVVAGAGDVYDPSKMNCISSGGYHCQYWDFALARYNSDGSLDESFGNAGKATTDLNRRGNDDFGRRCRYTNQR